MWSTRNYVKGYLFVCLYFFSLLLLQCDTDFVYLSRRKVEWRKNIIGLDYRTFGELMFSFFDLFFCFVNLSSAAKIHWPRNENTNSAQIRKNLPKKIRFIAIAAIDFGQKLFRATIKTNWTKFTSFGAIRWPLDGFTYPNRQVKTEKFKNNISRLNDTIRLWLWNFQHLTYILFVRARWWPPVTAATAAAVATARRINRKNWIKSTMRCKRHSYIRVRTRRSVCTSVDIDIYLLFSLGFDVFDVSRRGRCRRRRRIQIAKLQRERRKTRHHRATEHWNSAKPSEMTARWI